MNEVYILAIVGWESVSILCTNNDLEELKEEATKVVRGWNNLREEIGNWELRGREFWDDLYQVIADRDDVPEYLEFNYRYLPDGLVIMRYSTEHQEYVDCNKEVEFYPSILLEEIRNESYREDRSSSREC